MTCKLLQAHIVQKINWSNFYHFLSTVRWPGIFYREICDRFIILSINIAISSFLTIARKFFYLFELINLSHVYHLYNISLFCLFCFVFFYVWFNLYAHTRSDIHERVSRNKHRLHKRIQSQICRQCHGPIVVYFVHTPKQKKSNRIWNQYPVGKMHDICLYIYLFFFINIVIIGHLYL